MRLLSIFLSSVVTIIAGLYPIQVMVVLISVLLAEHAEWELRVELTKRQRLRESTVPLEGVDYAVQDEVTQE